MIRFQGFHLNLGIPHFSSSKSQVVRRPLRSPLPGTLSEKFHCVHLTHEFLSLLFRQSALV
jgi:hypothetical protein